MKRIISFTLALILFLSGCAKNNADKEKGTDSDTHETIENLESIIPDTDINDISFTGLDDPSFLKYFEDSIYAEIVGELSNDDYTVQTVSVKYLSKEYLEETNYNSKENIFFGFTLSELDEFFGDTKYVFSTGADGQTVVQELQSIKETDYQDQIIKNVAIGAGVILVCVVITVATEGAGAPAAAAIFAASAKTAATCALSGMVISGVSAGLVRAYQTGGDINESLKSAAVSGSEGFKWGAITGAITGGVSEAISIHAANASQAAASNIPTPRESELRALAQFGGDEQVSFLNGKAVPYGTPGATRPDLVDQVGKVAIEVKNYDLQTHSSLLIKELRRQIGQRVVDLPSEYTQMIVLDVSGRGYSLSFVQSKVAEIRAALSDLYSAIPIEVMW